MTAVPASSPGRLLRDCVLLLLLALVPALLSGWLHPRRPALLWSKPGVTEVELADVLRWSTPVLWVDARTADAYESQHVPDAIPLSEADWERALPGFLEAWRPDAKVIVYCDSTDCDSSQAVALRLQRELQLTEIYVLKGGWAAWRENRQ